VSRCTAWCRQNVKEVVRSSESTGPDLVQRLYVLDYGPFQVHRNQRIIGIPGYLIQTLDDVNILVDTGFPARYVDDPDGAARKIPASDCNAERDHRHQSLRADDRLVNCP